MKILSINISLPKKIIFNNEEVSTSIFKKPVNKKLKVQKSGIEGDMQADLEAHGGINKAVYAYSYTHYKYWGELLNNDFSNDYGLTHRENNSMSVYEISKLIFDSNNNIEKIKKAVKLDYLSDEIKTRFNVKLAKLGHYETL
jgi:MOSC domain-containing protein YiiM